MGYRDSEQNLWIKAGADPYIALVEDGTEKGFRMRYDSTPGGDEGISFGALLSEESETFATSEIFFDLVEARISINSSAFSDMVGPGMLIAGDLGELRFRTAGANDDYVIEHNVSELRITNYSDARQDLTITGDGKYGFNEPSPIDGVHSTNDGSGQAFVGESSNDGGLATVATWFNPFSTVGTAIRHQFVMKDSGGVNTEYSSLNAEVLVSTDGAEDGKFSIINMGGGTLRTVYEISALSDNHIWRGPDSGSELMRLTDIGLGIGGTATSTLQAFGSFSTAVRSVSAATTLDADDHTLFANPTPSAFDVDLPTAVGIAGREYVVKNTSTTGNRKVTLDASGAETIDGSLTLDISRGDAETIKSDGANWFRI